MAETFRLEITTPERMVAREDVEEAQIPARNGYLGVLPGHAPLLSQLRPGEISYRQGGRTQHLVIGRGLVEVLPEHTKVLVDTAEKAEEIDVSRARASQERAEQRLSHLGPETDAKRATVALQRALVRLQVASKAARL